MHQWAVLLRSKVHALYELLHLDLLPIDWICCDCYSFLICRNLFHSHGSGLAGPESEVGGT